MPVQNHDSSNASQTKDKTRTGPSADQPGGQSAHQPQPNFIFFWYFCVWLEEYAIGYRSKLNSSQVRLEVAKNIIIADGSFRVNSSRHRSRVMITSGYGEVTRNHPSYFRSCSNFHFTRGFKLGIRGPIQE